MERVTYDAIVVGAGPAGVTAAAGIARTGASVLLLEAGAYAGAENWSGCVYFTESLADDDAFGPAAVAASPFERRLVRRGLFVTDGDALVGLSHTGADTFQGCHTVLRPAFDPYWAEQARALGADYRPGVTVTSLIRRGGRVVGVHTERGPAYAAVTFLAEGDASHLVRYEGLERVQAPDFMQGVKAVYRLAPEEIERRFGLPPGEGAAHEYLVRNASSGGRTLKLNLGAFLYTNRDTLSLGYVVPLKNLARAFKGEHETLLGYVAGLPGIAGHLEGATLSAFGTKLIRTGGLTQSPILVEDGLAVGGAATGLGIDVPYPNFTGPASATGLCFARAFRDLAAAGKPFTTRNLTNAYLERLRLTRYWKDADHLGAWPAYLEGTGVLFDAAADLACGAVRHLTAPGPVWHRWWTLSRFLRDHLAPARVGRLATDLKRLAAASGLGAAASRAFCLKTAGRWARGLFRLPSRPPADLTLTLQVGGEARDLARLPPGVRGPVRRALGPLSKAMADVYRNDATPMAERMQAAASHLSEGARLADLIILLGVALGALVGATLSALTDLFRYRVLRVPAARLLDDAVGRDNARLRSLRALENVRGAVPMAARLATNTYAGAETSHIRVLWPESLPAHGELAEAPYWSVCPAGVYAFEPALSGHGVVTVQFENCIKCESCWQADEARVRWGRHTAHRLIYRPETPALDLNLNGAPAPEAAHHAPALAPVPALPESLLTAPAHAPAVAALVRQEARARRALAAFAVAVENLPPASDPTRTDWPVRVGEAAAHRLRALGAELLGSKVNLLPLLSGLPASPFTPLAEALATEAEGFLAHLRAGSLFEAVTVARRIRETVLDEVAATVRAATAPEAAFAPCADPLAPGPVEAALRAAFTDPAVKAWDRKGIDDGAAARLAEDFIALPVPTAADPVPAGAMATLRAWGAIHPGVGVLALAHLAARALTGRPGGAAADGHGLAVTPADGGRARLSGTLHLVPGRLADHLVVLHHGFVHTVPLDAPGVTCETVPATGLHPARFATVQLDLIVGPGAVAPAPDWFPAFLAYGYAHLALGAGDYLGRRAVEQAQGRIQFPGQMRDTAGRDGIAKFGAVKALVARTLAWRAVLERATAVPGQGTLCAALAAMAFSPANGRMGYDAGQIFGGTGYSEDDLLARFYRDSAVFPHLSPGCRAPASLAARWKGGESPLPLAARLAADAADLAALADGPLGPTVQRWQAAAARVDRLEMTATAARDALALTLGTFHLLTAAKDALEAGRPTEGPRAAVEVLLDEAADLLGRAEAELAEKPPFATAHFPELPAGPEIALDLDYDGITHLDDPYASGDFLKGPAATTPRVVPEVQLHDPSLRARWSDCYAWFQERCTTAPDDGGPYERYVERCHAIPPEILKGYQEDRFLATVVPADLDGLGWRKIDYYLLVSGAMRFGDASLSLLIMASTSIGTTPALIALDKEIPLVAKELGAFRDDPERLGAIRKGLDALVASLAHPDPARLERDFTRLLEQVEATIRRTKVTKYLAQGFLKTFYEAALAGKRRDFAAFASGLTAARDLLERLPATLAGALAELPRRERANGMFLQALGHGAVSAFALTEPTAGSDSGGVATVAHLKSVPLEALPDGRHRFEIDGAERFLLDADRIQFVATGMAYHLPDGQLAPVSTAGYDYATDKGVRTVRVDGEDLPFHDIAQVRDDGRYTFYELSGAKMWITNGRVATQFAMYVRTDEGVTGLLVDRHAEGLVVGRDEDKMGQQGSPTNELAIDRVRVPRECVIGYEGHGQVNALETLNVGRCGLAVAGVVMTRRLLAEAAVAIPPGEGRDRVLAEAAARIFASESLVYDLIGRFDNHHTRSVRTESAIAKYVCSELLHDCLDRVEPLYGPIAQTQHLLVEKMRRDARILNIYEGTNEVQRFLILRELCGLVPGWEPVPQSSEADGDSPAAALARWKEALRRAVTEATEALGDAVWQDTAMQPAFFPLAEMAGELYLLDCTLYRVTWLTQRKDALGADYVDPLLAVAARATRQCLERLAVADARYRRGREAALASRYPSAAVAADTAMEAHRAASDPAPPLAADAVLTCLLRPVALPAPAPRLGEDGALREMVWRMDPADAHALAQALAIRAAATGQVTVHAVSVGGPHGEAVLADALAAGADSATLLDLPPEADPVAWADALASLEAVTGAGLLLCGATCSGTDAPLAPFLAGRLGLSLFTGADLTVAPDGDALALASDTGESPLPGRAVAALTGADATLRPTLVGHARAAGMDIARTAGAPLSGALRFAPVAATGPARERATDVAAVAALVREFAEAARGLAAPPWDGPWEKAPLPRGKAVWTVAEPHGGAANLAAFAAARHLADLLELPARALLVGSESGIRALAGLARQAGIADAHGVDTGGTALSFSGRCKVLSAAARATGTAPARIVAPSGWEAPLAHAAGDLPGHPALWTALRAVESDAGDLVLTLPAYADRLHAQVRVPAATPLWLTASATAVFPAAPVAEFALSQASPRLAKADLDPAFVAPRADLTTAEVIVDVGLGAGTPEGLALARRLMEALSALGLSPHLGATRKVTQGLGLLGTDHQIGQTGVKVNPRLIFALGISGAPQHVDYIGQRADVIAFNKDPDAPLMGLQKPGLTVHPVVGDLFETVAALADALAESGVPA